MADRTSLQGYRADGRLFRVLDDRLRPIPLDDEGVMMTDYLGRLLDVRPGDRIQVQILDGRRAQFDVPVAGLVTEFVGVGAYLPQQALNRLLREGPAVSGAFLAVAPEALHALPRRLEAMPRVAGVTLREHTVGAFRELMAETLLVYALFVIVLAGSIAFAVVYNNARIALAERGRELSSLRVLGLTRGEVAYVLLGELAVLTIAAIPLGFALGAGLGWLLTRTMQTDLFRIPLVIEPSAFATAAAVVIVAATLSSVMIGRNLRRLDMVAALKAPE